jgi:hypothetical protein
VPTYRVGYILDLTFSNIPFYYSEVAEYLAYSLDYKTVIITILGRGAIPPERKVLRITEDALPRFIGLIAGGVKTLPDLGTLTILDIINDFTRHLEEVF